jgi:hypothetical protein
MIERKFHYGVYLSGLRHRTAMVVTTVVQAIQAGQLTFEDFFMADLNIPPMKVCASDCSASWD